MFVLGQLGPHASEYAVSNTRKVRDDGTLGGRMHGAEDKFGRGEFGDMLQEGGLPWRRRG